MRIKGQSTGLKLLDEFVSEGLTQFTSSEAAVRLGRSEAATGNLLARLVRDGLLDRVRRGHYAIRQLGTLGTTAAAENVLLSVAAGFRDVRHRVAYRTALDQLDLLVHPSRSIQVALVKPTLSDTLHIAGLAGRLGPLTKPSSDIDLEPGHEASSYRDAKWWVRWDHLPSELQNIVHQ